jgi:hypothetical protein
MDPARLRVGSRLGQGLRRRARNFAPDLSELCEGIAKELAVEELDDDHIREQAQKGAE